MKNIGPLFALQSLLKRDTFFKDMHCHSYGIKVDKHSLMGFSIDKKLKNAKHLESVNIDPKEEGCLFVMKMTYSCSVFVQIL